MTQINLTAADLTAIVAFAQLQPEPYVVEFDGGQDTPLAVTAFLPEGTLEGYEWTFARRSPDCLYLEGVCEFTSCDVARDFPTMAEALTAIRTLIEALAKSNGTPDGAEPV